MQMLLTAIKSPKDAAMMHVVWADSAYTPATAHMRRQQHRGDWMHYIQDCPHTPRIQDAQGMPDCLRYTGNVPMGWMRAPGSREMAAALARGDEDTAAGGGEVATDRSSVGPNGVRRAGWGLFGGEGDARDGLAGGGICGCKGPHGRKRRHN